MRFRRSYANRMDTVSLRYRCPAESKDRTTPIPRMIRPDLSIWLTSPRSNPVSITLRMMDGMANWAAVIPINATKAPSNGRAYGRMRWVIFSNDRIKFLRHRKNHGFPGSDLPRSILPWSIVVRDFETCFCRRDDLFALENDIFDQ